MKVDLVVQIGELRLKNTEIERMEIEQELGRHTTLALEFVRDRETDIQLADLLAGPVEVSAEADGVQEILFTGTVVDGSQSHLLNYGSKFKLSGATNSFHLSEHKGSRYFRNSTLADVAGALGAKVDRLAAPTEPLNYVQDDEADFDFLVRVADDHGCSVVSEGDALKIQRGFQEPVTSLVWGRDLLETEASARPVNPGFKGAFYQESEKKEHRFHGVRKSPELLSGAAGLTDRVQGLWNRVAGGGDPQVPTVNGRTPSLSDYKRLLERESERAAGSSVSVEGGSHNIAVKAGHLVDLQSSGSFDLPTQGQLGVVKVIHRFDGQQYSNKFLATPWAHYTSWRPPKPKRVFGVRTATVVDNSDPKNRGRVRLRYRWQDEGQLTGWARVCPPFAGNGRGVLFIPEIGDEALVVFEDGDPERPYVIGSLWNGKDQAPNEGPTVKKIVTTSGNTVRFVDDEGAESIEIFSARGDCMVKLSNDDGGTPVLTLHSEGDLSIEATGEIRMSCEKLVQRVSGDAYRAVEGSEQADVTGDLAVKAAQVLLEATAGEGSLKASGSAYLESAGEAVVKGDTVLMNSGGDAPTVEPEDPGETESTWEAKETPTEAPGKTSSDAPTPRIAAELMNGTEA